MKKTILGLAIMMAAGFSAGAQQSAANPATCSNTKCETEQCRPAQCNLPKCDVPRCPNPADCKGACQFNDLNITDAQRQKLQAAMQTYRQQKRQLFDNAKECRQRNDSVKCQIRKQAQELKQKQLAEIKSILSPEQYTKFLENSYLNSGQKQPKKGDFRKGDRKDRKDFGKDRRPQDRKMKEKGRKADK